MGSSLLSCEVIQCILLIAFWTQGSDAFVGCSLPSQSDKRGRSSVACKLRMEFNPPCDLLQRKTFVRTLGILPLVIPSFLFPSEGYAQSAGKISVTDKKEMLKLKVKLICFQHAPSCINVICHIRLGWRDWNIWSASEGRADCLAADSM